MHKKTISDMIKISSKELGFNYCGISRAEFLEEDAPHLENWLKKGQHGEMKYMENYFDKRLDPRLLVEGAKSVISLMLNYYPGNVNLQENSDYKISKYAYGQDYHLLIKDKLKALLSILREKIGDINGRAFVDSAPVLDKAWARKSGLGWMGKNGNIISKGNGSYFFLAELIIDVECEYDGPVKDYCGTCTACLDACPTQAILTPAVVDGSKCISYFTIELKNEIPEEVKGKFDNWIFGCDVCQDVCPWNRFSKPHSEPLLKANPGLLQMSNRDWEEITSDVFTKLFAKSAVKRTKLEGLKRNINFVKPSP